MDECVPAQRACQSNRAQAMTATAQKQKLSATAAALRPSSHGRLESLGLRRRRSPTLPTPRSIKKTGIPIEFERRRKLPVLNIQSFYFLKYFKQYISQILKIWSRSNVNNSHLRNIKQSISVYTAQSYEIQVLIFCHGGTRPQAVPTTVGIG